jgi:hypothetical protein
MKAGNEIMRNGIALIFFLFMAAPGLLAQETGDMEQAIVKVHNDKDIEWAPVRILCRKVAMLQSCTEILQKRIQIFSSGSRRMLWCPIIPTPLQSVWCWFPGRCR